MTVSKMAKASLREQNWLSKQITSVNCEVIMTNANQKRQAQEV
ncbi:hypothetical protein ACXQAU_002744 [Citrobacter freundii]